MDLGFSISGLYWGYIYICTYIYIYMDITRIMENQMEKNMDNSMETGVQGLGTCSLVSLQLLTAQEEQIGVSVP